MLEIEVKILGINIQEMEEKLLALGAKLIKKEKQINTVYDNERGEISGVDSNSYLRIREKEDLLNNINKNTLTFKKLISDEGSRKSEEINVQIDSKENMETILDKIGVRPTRQGFKKRISYELKGNIFDIDLWDENTYPDPYMEIESKSEESLNEAIKLLEIRAEQISTKSITELRVEKGLE